MFPELDDKKAALDDIRKSLLAGHLSKLKPGSSVSVTVAKPHDEPDGDEGDDGDKGDGDGAEGAPDASDVVKALGTDAKGEPPPEDDLHDPELMAQVAKALGRYVKG